MTTRRLARPSRLSCAISRMALIGFLFGLVDEGAGVDDDHVGVVGVGGDLVPRVAREAEHHLAVDEVLRATEGDKADFHRPATIKFEVRSMKFEVPECSA